MVRSAALSVLGAVFCLPGPGCSATYQPPAELPGIGKTRIIAITSGGDSAVVIPGPEYAGGWFHEAVFGEHYRDVWTAPVAVPVLDLKTFAGGLVPTEPGGGFQTKSLRFVGADGDHYKFRSADKDPTSILPPELRNTFAADLTKDQISASLPSASSVVDHLAGAAGVPQLYPRLVLLPDDERLGEFRAGFGGLLGVFERFPELGPRGLPGIPCAVNVQNGLKVFRAMDEDSRRRPDAVSYLQARLLDILVGDWDRHVKQWRWARCEEGDTITWYPVPMDRDQAFARFDGLVPWIAAQSVPDIEGFSDEFGDLNDLVHTGRFLDRRILAVLDRPAWDSVTADFLARVTDSVIGSAVATLPPEHCALLGERLSAALRARRAELKGMSEEYYLELSSFVDVRLSDMREVVEVERSGEDAVRVTAWLRDRRTGGTAGAPVYNRTFDGTVTREIRIYLLGGDDSVAVTGEVDRSIDVRVVAGRGDDRMVDRSHVCGDLWGVVPFVLQPDLKTWFYGGSGKNSYEAGPSCSVNDKDDPR